MSTICLSQMPSLQYLLDLLILLNPLLVSSFDHNLSLDSKQEGLLEACRIQDQSQILALVIASNGAEVAITYAPMHQLANLYYLE